MPFLAENLGHYVQEDATAALRQQHGIDVVEGEEASAIVVRIAWVDYKESIYRFDIGIRRVGGPLEVVETWTIDFANYSQLTGSVVERLPAALQRLREPAPEPAAEPAPEKVPPVTAPTEPNGSDPSPTPNDRKPATLGPLGIVGIVAGVGGITFGAIALDAALSEPTVDAGSGAEQEETGRRPSIGATVWTAAGFGTAAVGLTMLVVDLTVLRKRRARALSIVPMLGPSTAGLELTTRF